MGHGERYKILGEVDRKYPDANPGVEGGKLIVDCVSVRGGGDTCQRKEGICYIAGVVSLNPGYKGGGCSGCEWEGKGEERLGGG